MRTYPHLFDTPRSKDTEILGSMRPLKLDSFVIEERLLYGYYEAKSRCGFGSGFRP